jgi:hypothetical protein
VKKTGCQRDGSGACAVMLSSGVAMPKCCGASRSVSLLSEAFGGMLDECDVAGGGLEKS